MAREQHARSGETAAGSLVITPVFLPRLSSRLYAQKHDHHGDIFACANTGAVVFNCPPQQIEPLFRPRCDRLPRQTPLHQPRNRAVGTPDLTHTQLPSRTACRRCLTLPEPRVLASALCSAAVGTVQCDSKPGTLHAASQKLAPSVSLHLDGPRPHARLPFSLRWLPAVPAKLLLRSFAHWHPSCRPDAGYSQHPPEAALGWRPQMVSALNRTLLRNHA